MPSTKFPVRIAPFPWFTSSDHKAMSHQIYPNWRRSQRPVLPANAPADQLWHQHIADIGGPTQAHMDFHFLKFLASITLPTLVIMTMQDYGGETLRDEMVMIHNILWCDGAAAAGMSIPRIDYTELLGEPGKTPASGEKRSHWGPLVLCVTPLRPSTGYIPPRSLSTHGQKPPVEEFMWLNKIAEQFGLPKMA